MKKLILIIVLGLGLGGTSAFAYDYRYDNRAAYVSPGRSGLAHQSPQSDAPARPVGVEPLSGGLAAPSRSR